MFSLRPASSSDNPSSKIEEECFGWWIGAESQTPEGPPSKLKIEDDCPAAESSSTSSGDDLCLDDTGLDSTYLVEAEPGQTTVEEIELDRLDSGFDESSGRQTLCYTPERMIKCEEFRILTPSPKFFYPLQNLISHKTDLDDKGIEVASHLANLLLDPRRNSCRECCNVKYSDGEVLVHNCHTEEDTAVRLRAPAFVPYTEFGSCYELKRRLNESTISDCCSKDPLQQELADDTSGVSSGDGATRTLHDDWSSTEDTRLQPGRLSDESNYVSLEYAFTPPHKEKPAEISEVVSILAELENDPSRAETLLVEDDRFQSAQTRHDCYERLALSIEPDDHSSIKPPKNDPEAELERLYDKIERLQSSGKEIWEEIRSLRRNFSKDEWKVNHLSEDIKKLKNEFQELKYLDDLLNMFKGEIDKISKRNWPFVIGHTNYKIDEVNLVI